MLEGKNSNILLAAGLQGAKDNYWASRSSSQGVGSSNHSSGSPTEWKECVVLTLKNIHQIQLQGSM